MSGVVPDREQVKTGAGKVGLSAQNPLGLAIGAAVVGFLAGLLMPSTRVEDEKMGKMADQVKQTARESGQEALDRGKQVAQEVAGTAKEIARDQTQQQGEEIAANLQENPRQVVPTGSSTDL